MDQQVNEIRDLIKGDINAHLEATQAFKQSNNPTRRWLPAKEAEGPDMVMKLEKIRDLVDINKGWPIEIRNQDVLNTLLNDATVKVAVLGQYNRGKTHILNKLANKKCESGMLIHTEGLSVSMHNGVAYLDTAGENQPIWDDEPGGSHGSKWKTNMEAQIKRRMLSSQFLMELAIEMADVVVVVVNQLTLQDQQYISKVDEKMRRSTDKHAQMIIIHNLKDAKTTRDVDVLIQKDIVNAFHAVGQTLEGSQNIVTKNSLVGSLMTSITGQRNTMTYWKSNKYNALHLVYANELGQASKVWNDQSLHYVHDSMQHRTGTLGTKQMKRSLFKVFIDTCKDWFPIFFREFKKDDMMKADKYRFGILDGVHNGQPTARIVLVAKEDAELTFNDISVSNWEILYERKGDIYSLSFKIQQDNEKTLLHVEIPGVFDHDETYDFKEEKGPHNPFFAEFTWRRAGGEEPYVLKVKTIMAKGDEDEPGVHVHAHRIDELQAVNVSLMEMDINELEKLARTLNRADPDTVTQFVNTSDKDGLRQLIKEADEPEKLFKGPAAKNFGLACLKVQFSDHFPKGPQLFMDPEVEIEKNGMLKIKLMNASKKR